jgi:hypothetical protein
VQKESRPPLQGQPESPQSRFMRESKALMAALAEACSEDSSTGIAYAKEKRAVSQMKEGFILIVMWEVGC